MSAILDELVGRVMRKHPYSKTLLFVDLVTTGPEDEAQWPGGDIEGDITKFLSVAIKRGDAEGSDATFPALVVGDVIRISGGLVQNAEQSLADKSQRLCVLARPQDVTVVEKWSNEAHGFFSFESAKLQVRPVFGTEVRVSFRQPRLAVQCKQHSVERVLPALLGLCQEVYGEDRDNIVLRECSSCFIKSQDRLVLLSERAPGAVTQAQLLEAVVTDPVLGPAVMRVYSGAFPEAVATAAHPLLSTALRRLLRDVRPLALAGEVRDLRLHVSPKYMTREVLGLAEEDWVAWNPRDASHVLCAVLADGVWALSVAARDQQFIGDLRDKNSAPSFGGRVLAVESSADVCRAHAKLREAFARNGPAWDAALGRARNFRLAMDVGASPGGWTSYLAQMGCGAVVAVDKGELTLPRPWPTSVQHWSALGQQALALLVSLRDADADATLPAELLPPGASAESVSALRGLRVDLFCCDANISPEVSVGMLLDAAARGLLADRTLFVITCKNVFPRRELWEQSLHDCQARLQGCAQLLQLQHLLANTAKETTLSGILLAPGERAL